MNFIKKLDLFNKSSKGKVLKSILSFVFSAVMVVSVCIAYAWFAYNRNTDSNGMQLGPTYESMNATYNSFYINDLDSKTVIKGNQYNNSQGASVLDVPMLPFDMTFKSVNQYAPVVIRIQIYDVAAEFIPAANQTKTAKIVISRNTSLSFTTSATLDDCFSSVGQLGCYTNTSLALTATNSDIYSAILTQYRADSNLSHFTTVSNSTYTKVGYVEKTITYSTSDFKTDSQNKSCLVFYMCMDYSDTLATAYAEQEVGSLSNLNSFNSSFQLTNDITTVNVSFN